MGRGQVSLFVVLGIIVISLLAVVFYQRISSSSTTLGGQAGSYALVGSDSALIQNYGNLCLKNALEKGIFEKIAPQGGYIDTEFNPDYGAYDVVEFQKLGDYKVPYYYKNGKKMVPSLEDIEKKLGRYLLVEFDNCIDPNVFEERGLVLKKPSVDYKGRFFDLTGTGLAVKATFTESNIMAEVTFPLEYDTSVSRGKVENFHADIPITFKKDYEVGVAMLNDAIKAQPKNYDISANCDRYSGNGVTNLYFRNHYITEIYDYMPFYFNYRQTLKFRFLAEGLLVIGYCPSD